MARAPDLSGQQFGWWTVLTRAESDIGRNAQWYCRCKCKTEAVIRALALKNGSSTSCGCATWPDLTGKKFGRWTVLSQAKNHNNFRCWLCRCICGTESVLLGSTLNNGSSKSCGCLMQELLIERLTTHGHSKRGAITPEYRAWCNMRRRCYDQKFKYFSFYGGRGIKVCKRWRDSFEYFLADVGPRPTSNHSLDRYPNNDGEYKPGNVRWATKKEQANNRRPHKGKKR